MRAILTFHSIEDSRSVLSYGTRLFDALLAHLAAIAVPVCDLDTLLGNEGCRGVAITFDDGMKSVYRSALPVLKAHRAPAHLFLTTGAIGRKGLRSPALSNFSSHAMLGWREVEELHAGGVRIESHTHTHPDLRLLSKDQIAEECGLADELITSRLGRSPAYFAYPYGYHNRTARDCVREMYCGCVTTELRSLGDAEDKAALPRLDAYYLRSAFRVRFLDSDPMRLYLRVRSRLRTMKGSQCLPSSP